MAAFSDQLLVVTIMAYLAAMVCYAAEYAFSARPARALVPSGAPGAGSAPEPPEPPAQRDRPDGPPDRPQPARALLPWAARGLILSAAAVHLATVVTRGLAAERVPWGNMYEYLLTATLVATGAWLWSVTRYPAMRKLGIFVAMVNVLLLGLAGMVVYTPV
ncbi:MAG TPA: c-type cytochrome biogenesis protein CcsB, partial [Natronosporangium sp.]|nr:c-type cytochrome biogenesis protein CcsB [Natronosporangium sp.]